MKKGVFISYSHKDISNVEEIVRALKASLDMDIWYDNSLRGGEHFFSVIADKILEYDYFIFVVSKNSVNSKWCIQELEFAMSENKTIIAVWIENCDLPPSIRLVIFNTHYICRYNLDFDGLKEHLRRSFEEGDFGINSPMEDVDNSDRIIGEQKYFIKQEEREKIKLCLALEEKKKYSVIFKPENSKFLGLAYEIGIYTERDIHKAEFYYRAAMHYGDLDAKFLYMSLKVDKEDSVDTEFIEQMNSLAGQGSIMAMVYWGDAVYEGRYGMTPDKELSYKWWKKAAENHNPVAEYFLSYGYRLGEVVNQDYAVALMYALLSSESNFSRAFRIIGLMYRKGDFVKKDDERALAFFEKAVDLGDYLSLDYIGDIYYFDKHDFETAFTYYQEASELADKGKIKSGLPYYDLAWAYEHGEGTGPDEDKAIEYYLKASERKNKKARKKTAELINDSSKNEEEKLELLTKASYFDCIDAEYYIGKILTKKSDDPQNVRYAIAWYNSGMNKGSLNCIVVLIYYYSRVFGEEGNTNREKALDCFRLLFSLLNKMDDKDKQQNFFISNFLHLYYYAYAVELDIDEENNKPDKAHALYYYKKCLEGNEGITFWQNIVAVALGYLKPKTTGDVLCEDIPHGEEITMVLSDYLYKFVDFFETLKGEEEIKRGIKSLVDFRDCLMMLANNYNNSRFIRKQISSGEDKSVINDKASNYKAKLDEINTILFKMNNLIC